MLAPLHRHILAVLGLAGVGAACAGRLQDVIRAQAAGDLGCPEEQVIVRGRAGGPSYAVTACGRERSYQTACNSLGTCVAYPVGEQARSSGATGREDLWAEPAAQPEPAADVPGSDAPAVDGSTVDLSAVARALASDGPASDVAAEVDVPAATEVPLGEARAVTLRNDCERTVALFIGEEPASGAGRYTSLGSMNTATIQLRPGEPVWLLDAKGAGLTSIGVDGDIREIAVVEGCGGLSAR
jgi:hypothetical protein